MYVIFMTANPFTEGEFQFMPGTGQEEVDYTVLLFSFWIRARGEYNRPIKSGIMGLVNFYYS